MVKKFIVLGQPRSGTTMAAAGLAQHPNARCYLELLHAKPEERRKRYWISRAGRSIFDPPLYVVPDDRLVYQDGEDAADFLGQTLFSRPWPAEIAAVGLFLASPASDYATGQTFAVDRGYLASALWGL